MNALIPPRPAHPFGPTASRTRSRVIIDVATINLLRVSLAVATYLQQQAAGESGVPHVRRSFGAGGAQDWRLHRIDRPETARSVRISSRFPRMVARSKTSGVSSSP